VNRFGIDSCRKYFAAPFARNSKFGRISNLLFATEIKYSEYQHPKIPGRNQKAAVIKRHFHMGYQEGRRAPATSE
jgi:hypothetical protein